VVIMTAHRDPDSRMLTFWRAVVGLLGAFLCLFGVLGLLGATSMWSTRGQVIAGLGTNGALGVLSVLFGLVLVGTAARGGRRAWSLVSWIGVLFLLSAMVHLLVINSALNLLTFQFSNVIFSFLVGMTLLTVGVYLRTGFGHEVAGTEEELSAERATDRDRLAEIDELADAEHAMAEGHSTPEQEQMVYRDAAARAATEREAACHRDPQRRIKQARAENAPWGRNQDDHTAEDRLPGQRRVGRPLDTDPTRPNGS
jgi:hypothetical protein